MSRAETAMRPVSSGQYNDNDTDVDGGMAEVELHRLQRQYRVLESERKSYVEESRGVITRQTNSIKSLRKDAHYLSDELRLLKMQIADDVKSGHASKASLNMKEKADLYQLRIKEISQEIQNVDRKIAEVDRAITQQRATLGGAESTSNKQAAIQKQIVALENRLDKALVRFNKSLDLNSRLREQVDTLRRERLVFDNSYRKFERELAERKKQMADIIEASTSAHEARDEAQARMIALKERAEKEHQSFQLELKELGRQLEQDRKLKEFMIIKASERGEVLSHAHKSNRAQQAVKGSQEMLAESLDNYEKAFDTIKQVTSCPNINELVKRFTKMEDQNFSLFNYVNEVNNQTGTVAEEISSVERKIEQWNQANSHVEQENKQKLKELEEKLKTTLEATELFDKQHATMVNLTEDLEKGVDRLLAILPAGTFQKATGEAALAKNLGMIEQKTNEMLMKNLLLSLPKKFTAAAAPNAVDKNSVTADSATDKAKEQPAAETSKDPAALAAMLHTIIKAEGNEDTFPLETLLGQGPSAPVSQFSIHVPVAGDDADSDDIGSEEDERPLTREELKLKTLKSIAKRERKSANVADASAHGGNLSSSANNSSSASKHRRARKQHANN